MNKNILNTIGIILLGSVFIFSAIGKILDAKAFVTLIEQYGLGPSIYFAPLIPGLEIIIGLMLLLQVYPRTVSFISIILLFAFTVAFIYAHFVNNIQDCGCFSLIQSVKFPFWFTLLRNIVLIALSVWIWKTIPQERKISTYKLVVIFTVAILAFLCTGYTMNNPLLKDKDILTGRCIQNTELAQYIHVKSDSTYLLYIYASNCPHCWDATENVKKFKEMNMVDSIIGLTFHAGDSLEKAFITNFRPNFSVNYFEKEALQKITNKIPTLIWIRNDTIQMVLKEESISTMRFSYFYKNLKR